MPVWFWGLGRRVPPSHPALGCLHGCLPSSALLSAGLPWLMGCGVWPGDGQGLSLCCLPPPRSGEAFPGSLTGKSPSVSCVILAALSLALPLRQAGALRERGTWWSLQAVGP